MSSKKRNQNDLLELYNNIIVSLGGVVDESQVIHILSFDDSVTPTISGKPLVMPTKAILSEANWDKYVAFHPMSEIITRSESAVIKQIRKMVENKLQLTMYSIVNNVVTLAGDVKNHAGLTATQRDEIAGLGDIDEKTIDMVERVMEKYSDVTKGRTVQLHLKRDAELLGTKYNRVCYVHFPIGKELTDDKNEIFGIKMRKKDYVAIQKIFNWLLPGISTKDGYSFGGNANIAPYLDVLLRTFYGVQNTMNAPAWHFRKYCPNAHASLTWMDSEEFDLGQYKNIVPSLENNRGNEINGVTDQPNAVTESPKPARVAPKGPSSYKASIKAEPETAVVAAPPIVDDKVLAPRTIPQPGHVQNKPSSHGFSHVKPGSYSSKIDAEYGETDQRPVQTDQRPTAQMASMDWDMMVAQQQQPQYYQQQPQQHNGYYTNPQPMAQSYYQQQPQAAMGPTHTPSGRPIPPNQRVGYQQPQYQQPQPQYYQQTQYYSQAPQPMPQQYQQPQPMPQPHNTGFSHVRSNRPVGATDYYNK